MVELVQVAQVGGIEELVVLLVQRLSVGLMTRRSQVGILPQLPRSGFSISPMGSPFPDSRTRLHPTVSSDAQQDAPAIGLHLGLEAMAPGLTEGDRQTRRSCCLPQSLSALVRRQSGIV